MATARAAGLVTLRWVAAYSTIIGIALGSIIAAIITVHAATYPTASAAVGAMTICIPAMSSPRIGERSRAAQATAVTTSSPTHVTTLRRSRGTTITSQRGGRLGVILLVEVVRAVKRLHQIAVDRRLVARRIRRAHARREYLDARRHVGTVEERD